MISETFQSLFERALTEELGLIITVTNPQQFQVKCCNFVREFGDDRFREIMACLTSNVDKDNFALVKKSVEID